MDRPIYGFGHKIGAGKTVAARMLQDQYGLRLLSFAGPLKACLSAAFGFTPEQLYGNEKNVVDPYWGNSPGHYMQVVGTDLFRRHLDPDFWVKALFRQIDLADESVLGFVLDDCRFENEVEAIQKRGGSVIRIDREDPRPSTRSRSHPSETALDGWNGWDAVIDNSGNLEELRTKLIYVVDALSDRRYV